MLEIDEYVNKSSWREKSNANWNYSFSGLQSSIAGKVLAVDAIEKFGKYGKKHKDGFYHLHNLEGGIFGRYCSGNDLMKLLQEGLYNPTGVSSKPAQHLNTAIDHLINMTYIMTGEWQGAQAWSHMDILLAPYVRKDQLSAGQVKQEMQRMIWSFSFPMRPNFQSPFSNLTFGLRPNKYFENLTPFCADEQYKDMQYKDYQREIDMINKAFLDIMIEGANGSPFSFPLPTYNITKDFKWKNLDNPESVEYKIFELAAKWGTPYFSNYISTNISEEDMLSMCFSGEQTVFIKGNDDSIQKQPLRIIYDTYKDSKIKVFYNGKWVTASPVQSENKNIYNIELRNGVKITVTNNHVHVTKEGLKNTEELCIGDKIAFGKNSLETTNLGTYDMGYFIGTWLAEGSFSDRTINFTFGDHEIDSINKIKLYIEKMGYFASIVKNSKGNATDVRVTSNMIKTIIEEYIIGHYATEKHLSYKWYTQGLEFRRGLWEGWLKHDGTRMIEGYSASEKLINDMMEVATSLGILTNIRKNITDSNNFLNKERIMFTLHVCKKNKRIYTDEDENYIYVSITNIEKTHYTGKYTYCLEIDSKEHMFSLPNGMITHNCCRLRLNTKEIQKASGGIWNFGNNTGSLAVITINMARLGYLSNGNERKFYRLLDKQLEDAKNYLLLKKKYVEEGKNLGLFPMTNYYVGDKILKTYFLTVGLNGLNECSMNFAELNILQNESWCDEVLKYMRNAVLEMQISSGELFNFEATPAEGCSYSLAKIDREKFDDIYIQGIEDAPYYTGNSMIPMNMDLCAETALKHQSILQQNYTGGCIFHIDEGLEYTPIAVANYIKRVCNDYPLPYITWSPTFTNCEEHGKKFGKDICCDKGTNYTRVVGYYRPVNRFNIGKAQEFKEKRFLR